MILTEQEITAIDPGEYYNDINFAREIEAAVIAKLASDVSVEPAGWFRKDHLAQLGRGAFLIATHPTNEVESLVPLYTAEAIAAARVAENERCAKVCETTVWSADIDVWRDMTKKDVSVKSMLACADAIRALKETP